MSLEEIRSEVKRPADFDHFWQEVKDELAQIPMEWERIPDETLTTDDWTVDWLRVSSLDDLLIYGWLAVPKFPPQNGQPQNGYLWLPGYSLGNPPPRAESLYPNTITFGLNIHGNLPNTPYTHPSVSGADYITEGIKSPQTYIYRRIIGHCLRALDVLAQQPEVNPEKLMVGGMSQGGGLALITAALSSHVKLCFADMPWLCDLDRALSLLDRERYKKLKSARYPDARGLIADYAEAHPESQSQIYQTYRYFDPLSHAATLLCPTQMSAGGLDPSCKPPTIYAVYNQLGCEKEMLFLPRVGHEMVPAMHEFHAKWVQRLG